jgi:hypothetical protein
VVEWWAVVEALEQSNPTLWKPMLQLDLGVDPPDPLGWLGYTTVTFFAPPHWVFLIIEPPELQADFCLQVDPSGMP